MGSTKDRHAALSYSDDNERNAVSDTSASCHAQSLVAKTNRDRHKPCWPGCSAENAMPTCLDHGAQLRDHRYGDSCAGRHTEMPSLHRPRLHVVESGASGHVQDSSWIHVHKTVNSQPIDSLEFDVGRRRAPERRTRKRERCLRVELTRERVDPPPEVRRDLPAD